MGTKLNSCSIRIMIISGKIKVGIVIKFSVFFVSYAFQITDYATLEDMYSFISLAEARLTVLVMLKK